MCLVMERDRDTENTGRLRDCEGQTADRQHSEDMNEK